MKKLATILLMVLPFLSVSLSSQTPNLDSLLKELSNVKADTNRVNLLVEIGNLTKAVDRKEANKYIQEAIDLAERIEFIKGLGNANYQLITILHKNGEVEQAIQSASATLEFAKNNQLKELEIRVYLLFCSIYQDQNDLEKALLYNNLSLEKAQAINNRQLEGEAYHALARVNNVMGEIEEAKKYILKAIEIFEPLGNIKKLASLYQGISTVTYGDEAFAYAKKGLAYFELAGDLEGTGFCHSTFGAIKYEQNDFEGAISHFEDALAIFEQVDLKEGISYTSLNLASTLLETERYQEAIQYFKQAIRISRQLGYEDIMQLAYEGLVVAYADQGKPQLVGTMMDSMKAIRDTLYNREKADLIVSANERFKTKEKEVQLANQELELQKQKRLRNGILLIGASVIFLLLIFFQYLRNQSLLKRKAAESALQIKKAEASKLRELDELKSSFFANISHEFRTPLSLILGPVRNALEQIPASETLEEIDTLSLPPNHLMVMERNAVRLQNLIDQLLDLSKLDNGKMKLQVQEGKIIQYLRSIVFSFESLAETRRIHLQTAFPAEPKEAYFDPDKLEKILVNILSNAFKFTPENGSIKVNAQFRNQLLKINISDSGAGIAMENLDKIFDRFYQVQGDEYQGTGIGLALVKELVSLHKGQISVESSEGQGTSFSVSIPYDKAAYLEDEIIPAKEIQTAVKDHSLLLSPGLANTNIKEGTKVTDLPIALIVEDNPDLRQYIAEILNPHYAIHTAVDGKAGLDKAINLIPDIIISDIMMPKMNGMELCHAIKEEEKTSHIPVILLTAKAGQESKLTGLKTGADDYLTKPFDAKELKIRMQNLIEQRARLQQKYQGQLKIRPKQITVTSMDERFLKQVMSEIESNLGNEFYTVEELARSVGFSRSQLHRKLKALCDKSPNELIRDFRLTRAKELLEQKAGNVSEIAYQVGYSNLSYFTKSFKKAFGIIPSELV